MKIILNFFKNLLFESQSDMIGLATIKKNEATTTVRKAKTRKEYSLTEMLRRSY